MLRRLQLRDFVIVEGAEIDFEPGFRTLARYSWTVTR